MAGGTGRIRSNGDSLAVPRPGLRVAHPAPSAPLPSLRALRDASVVVLPDLFIDALAFLPPWPQVRPKLDAIARRGGGNLPIGPVEFKLGGNAANLALGLARLGARVDLIAETDELGLHLLEHAAHGTRLRMDRVRIGAHASATLGLEAGGANVMLSHAGPLGAFGPERLAGADWRLIEDADAVAFTNWAQNAQGTELLRRIAARVSKRPVFLYVDTGDPRHRLRDVRQLVSDTPTWNRVDALGLNENELRAFASDATGDPIEIATRLSERMGTRLDLHTRRWAASVRGPSVVRIEAHASPAKRLTGAGDAWNAGNLAGHVLRWPEGDRLRLAHRVANQYVTAAAGLPPTARELAIPVV